ncbi:1-deoxy-D-xylulose-5-phosphate synthase [Anaerorhabdus furcosa]|uniref:1-deoxy-D-xylulose-5-phosphate synthase n=1 Tax=Anaerorhabdus furcosa TaxID=118967 RepID=A0A1T4PFI3_9FIRM|nr:1-deoxy-D-xylulose-5-phosphate synthase [Anaerorhabdus furcosa]SJZ90320.1 1-deoxy-D-xylulose-5-phosphate synthase [Anaerorhabdus furcosa]
MDINKIQNPLFLKDLTIKECNTLANDIRSFLIDSVSKTGGHLSSNLGVVELTIALHKVFNSPEDKILFDVGHQSYIHKILTGRAKDFKTLRQYKGISGFQKREESDYDCWEAGHSSTVLSAALGMAVARDLEHKTYNVIPVVGDGSIVSGMSLEALNQIGSENKNMIIIFNDNNMSISQNVGALTNGFSKLRTSKPYTSFKTDVKSILKKNEAGKTLLAGMSAIKDKLKDSVVESGLFGEFGLEYLGPVDGHNIKDLIHILEAAKKHDGPVVVHVLTRKGKGYKPCENDKLGSWHGVGPFDVLTGKSLSSTPVGKLTWSEILSETLCRIAKTNEDVVAITPAMITGSKLEKFFAAFPTRSFDCGIAEEHATTFAAGLAIAGKRPYLCIYSSFLQRAYDQINHDICRMDLPVVIGIDRAGLVGEDGSTHHGVFDISMLKSIPNLILCQPKDGDEAQQLLVSAFMQNHPLAIRYPRGTEVYKPITTLEEIKMGSWTRFNTSDRTKCIVMTYGPEVDKVLTKIKSNDLPVEVINCRFFKPIDEDMLRQITNEKCPIVTYETDMLEGGLATSILEWACDHHLQLNLSRIGIQDEYITHGSLNQIRKEAGIDIETLFEKIDKLIK